MTTSASVPAPTTRCHEEVWPRLVTATLNKLTETNCLRLTERLAAVMQPPPAAASIVRRLAETVFRHVTDSDLYAPQYAVLLATVCGGGVLEHVVWLCGAALLDQQTADSWRRRHCAAFVGPLLVEQLIEVETVGEWMRQLERRCGESTHASVDASVDTLCHLMTAVGAASPRLSPPHQQQCACVLKPLVSRLRCHVQQHGHLMSARRRCLLLNMLELSDNGWMRPAPLTPRQILASHAPQQVHRIRNKLSVTNNKKA